MIPINLVKARLRLIEVIQARHFVLEAREVIDNTNARIFEETRDDPRLCVVCGCRITNINPKVFRCSFCTSQSESSKDLRSQPQPYTVWPGQYGHRKENIRPEAYERPEEL